MEVLWVCYAIQLRTRSKKVSQALPRNYSNDRKVFLEQITLVTTLSHATHSIIYFNQRLGEIFESIDYYNRILSSEMAQCQNL